ncbi:hypothetical protein RclHR1_05950016 [Rhizophagus clarus]|uniref:F-box domain-containing protein n=1 Tax=Rhizophagus clarus TaxID=94130 RepID=A0A2Z6S838_9GLOM|nr:hypothetical protein RclHR1_05950016 [Rhizophagus clarus]GES93073.1 hypothetical protein GLOIN_2v1881452 [Rhizophagus clarus]
MKTIKRILDLEEKNSISIKQKKKCFPPKSPILDSFFSSFHLTKQKPASSAIVTTTTTTITTTTKNTPTSQCPYPLIIDCLEEIFSHLIDDKLTLFSCIRVNRLWLNLCIPLLWNNPFDYSIPQKNQLRLIRTYISCLSINDKQKLLKFYLGSKEDNTIVKKSKKRNSLSQPFKVNYFYQNDSLKYSQISLHHEPLFIYPKYLRSLNYNNFDSAIRNYCHWNRPLFNPLIDSLDEYKHLVFDLLNNLIFNNNVILLKHLRIKFGKDIRSPLHDYYFVDNNDFIINNVNNNNNDITFMMTGVNTFTRLTNLDLSYIYSGEISKVIPQQISNICSHLSVHSTHIQSLTIFMQKWKDDEFKHQVCFSIFDLIKSQKYLKSLSINEFWNTNYNTFNNLDLTDQFYQILLDYTSNTLEYLQFYELNHFDLLLNILGNFKYLKNLEIKKLVKPNNYSSFFHLNSSKINNLSLKKFDCNYSPFENFYSVKNPSYDSIIINSFISPIIKSSNLSLEFLSLSKISKNLLSTITLYCPNITHLSLFLDSILISDFCALLVFLSKLHFLTIKKSFHKPFFNDILDIKNLATNLPISLYYFKTDLFDNSKSLTYFLENCNIDVKLGVLEIYQHLVDDNTLKAVLNYKKKSNDKLKIFRYSGNNIVFNDQTWESAKNILSDLVKINWN